MTPASTPSNAHLPPLCASAGIDDLLIAPESTGAVWVSLSQGFARFFAPPASTPDAGECTMDSPSL